MKWYKSYEDSRFTDLIDDSFLHCYIKHKGAYPYTSDTGPAEITMVSNDQAFYKRIGRRATVDEALQEVSEAFCISTEVEISKA